MGSMLGWASAAAVILYLAPIGLFVAARSRRDKELWELALDVPLGVALDLLFILALARVLTLESAIFVSRAFLVPGGALWLLVQRKRGRLAWPMAIGRREIVFVMSGAVVAVLLSLRLSRPASVWDRGWHIPLVTSLLGQKLPFMNVYEPSEQLYYHFTGNVLAGIFQALSLWTMHSALALSMAHDVLFALTGATLALLLRHFGVRNVGGVVVVIVAALTVGPASLLNEGASRPTHGYSLVNFFSLTFRPHVCLGALLMLGFVGSALVRLRHAAQPVSAWKTIPVLVATTAVLILTDETSVGLLGLALGAAWLMTPDVIHPQRLKGIGVLAGLLGALVFAVLIFGGSFAPGAPSHSVELVPWQNPGFARPRLPLSEPGAWRVLLEDLLAIVGVVVAGTITVLRARTRPLVTVYVFFVVLVALSVIGLTRLEFDGSPLEGHRFVSAALFLSPVFAAYFILRGRLLPSSPPTSFESLIAVVSIGIGVGSTLEWLSSGVTEKSFGTEGHRKLYSINCRWDAGAQAARQPRPAYVSQDAFALYAGCTPSFLAGPRTSEHKIKVSLKGPQYGLPALRVLHDQQVSATENLPVICEVGSAMKDPVCSYAVARNQCQPQGAHLQRCLLTPSQRRELLDRGPR